MVINLIEEGSVIEEIITTRSRFSVDGVDYILIRSQSDNGTRTWLGETENSLVEDMSWTDEFELIHDQIIEFAEINDIDI